METDLIPKEESEGRREGGDEGRLSSQRVNQLSQFLRHQQEVVYKQHNISKYFLPAIQKDATRCWEQIHPKIGSAVESKYGKLLEELKVTGKLAELDRQHQGHSKTERAWRPTGIPEEDCLTAESTEASQLLPDFEEKLTQAETLSSELERKLREREAELAELDQEIEASLNSLAQTSTFAHTTSIQQSCTNSA